MGFETTHDVIEAYGSFGRYQRYYCIVIQYSAILSAGLMALGTFGQFYPTCPLHANETSAELEEGICRLSECRNNSDPVLFHSMAMEWDLVCDRNLFLQAIIVGYGIGHTFGHIIGGHISDYFGRKRAFYPAQFAVCIVSALSTASTHWATFATCYALTGFFTGIVEATSFVLCMECTDWKHRWIVNACFQLWIQYAVVALVAYLSRDWRLYLIILNVLVAPLLVFYLLFLESPRYLIYKQELGKALHTITDIASDRWNNMDLDICRKDLERIPGPVGVDPTWPTVVELFRSWDRAKMTISFMLGSAFLGCVTNFFIHNVNAEQENSLGNIAIFGLSQTWVPVLIICLDWKYQSIPRKTTYLTFLIATIVCVLIDVGLLLGEDKERALHLRIFGILGASLSQVGVHMSLAQIAVESYPTAVRGIGYGCVMAFEGVGVVAGTVLRNFGYEDHGSYVPLVVFAVLGALAWVFGFYGIPETMGHHMQDGLNYCERRRVRPKNDPSTVCSITFTKTTSIM